MKEFAGKVAVITGAAEGIGKAIAEEAAARGMKLVLADIDAMQGSMRDRQEHCAPKGADADGLRVDVFQGERRSTTLPTLRFAHFGRVHLLVANAGVACAKPAWETTTGDWDWVMGVNFHGVTHAAARLPAAHDAPGEEGHVVATASMAGLLSPPSMAAYNASKHAVVTVMEGLHHDLTLRGATIGASVLCPGWVKTRISLSERNRTAGEATRVEALDPVAAKLVGAVHEAVADGIEPAEVARAVFEAIAGGRFYILTHADSKAGVKARLEDILGDRPPTLVRL